MWEWQIYLPFSQSNIFYTNVNFGRGQNWLYKLSRNEIFSFQGANIHVINVAEKHSQQLFYYVKKRTINQQCVWKQEREEGKMTTFINLIYKINNAFWLKKVKVPNWEKMLWTWIFMVETKLNIFL